MALPNSEALVLNCGVELPMAPERAVHLAQAAEVLKDLGLAETNGIEIIENPHETDVSVIFTFPSHVAARAFLAEANKRQTSRTTAA